MWTETELTRNLLNIWPLIMMHWLAMSTVCKITQFFVNRTKKWGSFFTDIFSPNCIAVVATWLLNRFTSLHIVGEICPFFVWWIYYVAVKVRQSHKQIMHNCRSYVWNLATNFGSFVYNNLLLHKKKPWWKLVCIVLLY